jgi:pimeloyl-ACP methyl ester carboxylesterase
MKISIYLVLLFVLFTGCSTKLPNTWKYRVSKNIENDLELNVDIKGEGPPLIFLHGFGMSKNSFRYIVPKLSKTFKTYNFDLKGFGDSPKPDDGRYSPYDQAVLVNQYIKRHNLKNVKIIGNSYGGGVALSLALMDSKNIDKIVLISPAVYKQELPSLLSLMHMPIIGWLGYNLTSASYKALESYKFAYYDDSKITDKMVSLLAKDLQKDNSKSIFYDASFDLIPDDIENISKKYTKILTPTLIIWGDNDVIIGKHNGYRLNRDLKNSKLKIIKKCGHLSHEEKPKEVLKYILNFF